MLHQFQVCSIKLNIFTDYSPSKVMEDDGYNSYHFWSVDLLILLLLWSINIPFLPVILLALKPVLSRSKPLQLSCSYCFTLYLFHPFTSKLLMVLNLRCVSCKQHRVRSAFLPRLTVSTFWSGCLVYLHLCDYWYHWIK